MQPFPAEARGAPTPAKCAHCGGPFTPSLGDQSLCDPCQGLVPPEPRSHLRESDVAGCKLIHQLGAGRFSTSWLAEGSDGSSVVVKLLHAYAPDPATVQRFLGEVQRVAPLSAMAHASVAPLLTGGVQLASALFLVYRSGGDSTLADELRSRGRIVASRALELGAQLAEAFGAGSRTRTTESRTCFRWNQQAGARRAALACEVQRYGRGFTRSSMRPAPSRTDTRAGSR